MNAGQQLRLIREDLGLTIRDVEAASSRIAAKYGNNEYGIPLSRLSDIETKGVVPSIYRLYSLAAIYRRDYRELLALYNIRVEERIPDTCLATPPRSHRISMLDITAETMRIPVRLNPGFSLDRTCNLGRMIEQWGLIPLQFLQQFEDCKFTYGYIGLEDLTMYPLIMPGSFIQVDESKTRVTETTWHSEYQRPIYFVETREGNFCCWCALKNDQLIMQPHPLSPVQPKVFKNNLEAEVVGQVVAVAMRLDFWSVPADKARRAVRELR